MSAQHPEENERRRSPNKSPEFRRQCSELTHIASNCTSRILPEPSNHRRPLHLDSFDSTYHMQPPAPRATTARALQPPDDTTLLENHPDNDVSNENDSHCSSSTQYYRIVYPGVVAVLSSTASEGLRTGQYLSYGEVLYGTPSSANEYLIIHSVLTGGYALDASMNDSSFLSISSNLNDSLNMTVESPDHKRLKNRCSDTVPSNPELDCLGYIYLRQNNVPIVEPWVGQVPQIESGTFSYRVIATSPLPILTGPDRKAPKTNSVLLPGTVHDISIRMPLMVKDESNLIDMEICFLRLKFRRGWVADRQIHRSSSIPVMQEIVDAESQHSVDESSTTSGSVMSGTVSTYTSSSLLSQVSSVSRSRHRHRPPRRRQDASAHSTRGGMTTDGEKMMPRFLLGGKLIHNSGKDTDMNESILTDQSMTFAPSANVSIMSDDSSLPMNQSFVGNKSIKVSQPQGSLTTNYFLMRVMAPKGLKILDTPQFQVNRLIRNNKQASGRSSVASSHMVSKFEQTASGHHSIFQTMPSRLNPTGSSQFGNSAFFDVQSKSRILPCGALFEASTRMEATGSYNQGAGLIKLSDNSGWAIVPRQSELEQQYRHLPLNGGTIKEGGKSMLAYEEVGSATLDNPSIDTRSENNSVSSLEIKTHWVRVISRAGIPVSCAPLTNLSDEDAATSPSSSRESSAATSSNQTDSNVGSNVFPSNDSDVASSVGSSFLDSLFRTPQKKKLAEVKESGLSKSIHFEKRVQVNIAIPCGMALEVERCVDGSSSNVKGEFARLAGGQGWIPLFVSKNPTTTCLAFRPSFRYGSFWYRVQSSRGIKVRFGPSNRAASIKSNDGEYFRFECGEFLRASEIVTIFAESGDPVESFAKLYRNRHVRLHSSQDDIRSLPCLTIQSEWVQIHSHSEVFLEECLCEPRIERHKQGWRYNVVPDNGIAVRKGPSFAAEKTGLSLFGGESIIVNERVTPSGDTMSWLRLNDGQGWIHDFDANGEQIVTAHSLRHRAVSSRSRKPENEEIAYNAIISRLFHNDDVNRQPQR